MASGASHGTIVHETTNEAFGIVSLCPSVHSVHRMHEHPRSMDELAWPTVRVRRIPSRRRRRAPRGSETTTNGRFGTPRLGMSIAPRPSPFPTASERVERKREFPRDSLRSAPSGSVSRASPFPLPGRATSETKSQKKKGRDGGSHPSGPVERVRSVGNPIVRGTRARRRPGRRCSRHGHLEHEERPLRR